MGRTAESRPPAGGTWRDWLSPGKADPELVTRDELLATVERWGVAPPVTERTLRYWEDEGVLPRATRDGPPGRERAVYPWWVADLIAQVRQYQDRGADIKQLPMRMRMAAYWLSKVPSPRDMPERPGLSPARPPTLTPELGDLLSGLLSDFATLHYLHDGAVFDRVELRFHAATGETCTYTLPLDPPRRKGS